LRSPQYVSAGEDPLYVSKKLPKYNEKGSSTTELSARVDDFTRISKMFMDKPGKKFLLNQALLQTETQKGSFLQKLGGSVLMPLKIMGSILAQVPVNGTGTHFINGFGGFEYLTEGAPTSSGLLKFLSQNLGVGNKGINGAERAKNGKTIILDNTVDNVGDQYNPYIATIQKASNSKLVKPSTQESKFTQAQAGTTIIPDNTVDNVGDQYSPYIATGQKADSSKLVKPTTQESKFTQAQAGTGIIIDNTGEENYRTFTESTLEKEAKVYDETQYNSVTVSRLETDVKKSPKVSVEGRDPDTEAVPGNTIYLHKTKGSAPGVPGTVATDRNSWLDQMYLEESNVDRLAAQTRSLLSDITKRHIDIIPFEFEVITPESSQFLYFRAFLDSFDDSYTGTWSGTQYIGRAEEFYTYQGFKRDISFGFKVAAQSQADLKPLYQKLNILAGTTAPSYASGGQFMRGTLCKLTIGDLISQQNGFIGSVKLSWDKEFPWEINVENEEGLEVLPHVLNVSVTFTPIHTFNVKSNIDGRLERYFGKRTS